MLYHPHSPPCIPTFDPFNLTTKVEWSGGLGSPSLVRLRLHHSSRIAHRWLWEVEASSLRPSRWRKHWLKASDESGRPHRKLKVRAPPPQKWDRVVISLRLSHSKSGYQITVLRHQAVRFSLLFTGFDLHSLHWYSIHTSWLGHCKTLFELSAPFFFLGRWLAKPLPWNEACSDGLASRKLASSDPWVSGICLRLISFGLFLFLFGFFLPLVRSC